MFEIFASPDAWIALLTLTFLEIVLGIDNIIFISIAAGKLEQKDRKKATNLGLVLAMAMRIVLLFGITWLTSLKKPFWVLNESWIHGGISWQALILFLGGLFLLYKSTKEIHEKVEDRGHDEREVKKGRSSSLTNAIIQITVINIVFSFDSILSAIALTDVFWVMATAIVISGILMIWLAERVSNFLKKNRMYEVLGLFILFVVGIMLVTEGGHLAHLTIFSNPIVPMSKTTFYFVIFILVLTDIVQGRYQRKISKELENNRA